MTNSFERDKLDNIRRSGLDTSLRALSTQWVVETAPYRYVYNFTWLGRPIIQFPQDILALQEIIWQVRPDLIVETGVAHGGSLILYASLLELIGHGQVVGVDIDIRAHNRAEIEKHPMFKRITLIEGSSVDESISRRVRNLAREKSRVLVVLDSNHTSEHVLRELRLYAPLVTRGSYLVVFDTVIEDMPEGSFPDRPWGKGNNPSTAVREFMGSTDRFVVDKELDGKLLITAAPGGYLKCVKD
jgi:cephalosporin hydroxylase